MPRKDLTAITQHNSKNRTLISVKVFSVVMLISVLVKIRVLEENGYAGVLFKLMQCIPVKVIKCKAFMKNHRSACALRCKYVHLYRNT